jgi:hypothetical protein
VLGVSAKGDGTGHRAGGIVVGTAFIIIIIIIIITKLTGI